MNLKRNQAVRIKTLLSFLFLKNKNPEITGIIPDVKRTTR
jgi:hypothetical protein